MLRLCHQPGVWKQRDGPLKYSPSPRTWIQAVCHFGSLQCKLGWIYQEGQSTRECLRPEGGFGVSEVEIHVGSCRARLWLPDFWHSEQELDCSAISSLLADYQRLVSSRAGIRKTAFPRKISLSETLTIGPPSRKMRWGACLQK